MLAFLGAGDEPHTPEEAYCEACRKLGEDDCANCNREIEVMDV